MKELTKKEELKEFVESKAITARAVSGGLPAAISTPEEFSQASKSLIEVTKAIKTVKEKESGALTPLKTTMSVIKGWFKENLDRLVEYQSGLEKLVLDYKVAEKKKADDEARARRLERLDAEGDQLKLSEKINKLEMQIEQEKSMIKKVNLKKKIELLKAEESEVDRKIADTQAPDEVSTLARIAGGGSVTVKIDKKIDWDNINMQKLPKKYTKVVPDRDAIELFLKSVNFEAEIAGVPVIEVARTIKRTS